jgi:hypothetical protein
MELQLDATITVLLISNLNLIKIDIKTAPTCFGAVTPSSGSALLVLALFGSRDYFRTAQRAHTNKDPLT